METLIIILIVVLILQTGVFTYSHFFDINANKSTAATMNVMETAVAQYADNISSLQKSIQTRDDNYKELNKAYNELVKMQNLTVKYLPNAIEKEAMRQIVEGENLSEGIKILKGYYDWVKTIKYKENDLDETPINDGNEK